MSYGEGCRKREVSKERSQWGGIETEDEVKNGGMQAGE